MDSGPEFDTWVPFVRNNIPRPVILGSLMVLATLSFVYAREQTLNAAFYLAIVVLGNGILWKLENWTASRDRAAIQAGVPTRGWGADPSQRFWTDRLTVDAEVRKKEKQSKGD